MFLSAPISSRVQFGDLLNQRNLLGQAVEVGTHKGEFAEAFLRRWAGNQLHCVDHWLPNYDPKDPAALGNREQDQIDCINRLRKFGDKVSIIKADSSVAAKRFSDKSLDFVYIDGDHRKSAVYGDLVRWYVKLRPGGILAGHDFVCPGEPNGHGQYVQDALNEYLTQLYGRPNVFKKSRVHLVVEEGGLPWSFYLFKEE